MPGTAAQLGVDRYHVESNLRGGAKYLRRQLDRFGHYHLALAAYNAGPGRVRNGAVPRIPETRDYVDNVLLNWSRLSGFERRATIVPQVTVVPATRSEEHPSELQSLMRISYAVFCLKKKTNMCHQYTIQNKRTDNINM